ncbi:hypothetical protein GGS23DRAFT_573791 [Durotheca rogersii]|uniref:uncharacterized protein n=1 Tax=Durotheca rogersii TaxID=419775 RepID=UPI00221F721D|nr:uncharacterized protein GGS23DRAFT_573791 [Durotheca rogersii]KAI5861921.1 hypothetical protein GGS23DRAFT_573791 [Durotheca rogersii]
MPQVTMPPNQDGGLLPTLNWAITNHPVIRAQVDDCFNRTNWEAICESASRANSGRPCKTLPDCINGGNNLARLLEFQDGTRWVARIQLRESTPETSRKMQTEIDTLAFLKTATNAPVPQVFAFELDGANPAGVAFVLLEFLPGKTAMDEARDYNWAGWGLIPRQYRQTFYRSMAAAHVQIASARLPQIGTVTRDAYGGFIVGPIPGIGGPFETAASFIQAWAATIKYPYNEDYLRQSVPSSVVDEILKGVDEFPGRLAKLASSGKYFTSKGPFPIRHADLFHSNVIVTKTFNVLGVIDWEGACTVPWELVDAPCFLSTIPRLLNPPEQYDEAGRPLDSDEVGMWADEEAYAAMVREAERNAHADHRLSNMLADKDAQDLARTIHLFPQGKAGFYGRALDYFENK